MNTLRKLLYQIFTKNIRIENIMPKIQDLTGETFGIWKVIKKTNKKALCGAYLYECLNIKSNEIVLKHAGYLKQFKDRKSSKTTAGRKRKWIIIKKPYIE